MQDRSRDTLRDEPVVDVILPHKCDDELFRHNLMLYRSMRSERPVILVAIEVRDAVVDVVARERSLKPNAPLPDPPYAVDPLRFVNAGNEVHREHWAFGRCAAALVERGLVRGGICVSQRPAWRMLHGSRSRRLISEMVVCSKAMGPVT